MTYDAILFDLDGTLADTLDDIAAVGNAMLTAMGRETLEREKYRFLAGQGARWLVEHALGTDDPKEIERGYDLFRAAYSENNHRFTRPYDGVPAMLDAISDAEIARAVLSNKPHQFTLYVMDKVFGRWSFDAIAGARDDVPLKPDPAGAVAIANELDIRVNRWAYLGDTRVDMLTARAAGMFAIGCTWGFREESELRESGADAIVHHPREVMAILHGGT